MNSNDERSKRGTSKPHVDEQQASPGAANEKNSKSLKEVKAKKPSKDKQKKDDSKAGSAIEKQVPSKGKKSKGKEQVSKESSGDTDTANSTTYAERKKETSSKVEKSKLKAGKKEGSTAEIDTPGTSNNKQQTREQQSGPAQKQRSLQKIIFQIRYHTIVGQQIFVSGNHPLLGNNNLDNAFPLQYLNEDYWFGELELPAGEQLNATVEYKYLVRNAHGIIDVEIGGDKTFDPAAYNVAEVRLIDTWNFAGHYENAFFTEPFKNVLLKHQLTPVTAQVPETYTHTFRVKAPLLAKDQVINLFGSAEQLGKWNVAESVPMVRKPGEDYWTVSLDLSTASYPITYKYGVVNLDEQQTPQLETGINRVVYDGSGPDRLTVLSDGFAALPAKPFKGAGVAIPVFSLRSQESFGVGEFNDMKLLVDWAKQVGLKVVQLLPLNDTIATHTWVDSYPYAAISAFALHPIFLHLPTVASAENAHLLQPLEDTQKELNALEKVDYEKVLTAKLDFVQSIFASQKEETFASGEFKAFFDENRHWLVPYAAFSYLRDEYGTPDFSTWPQNSQYNEAEIAALAGSPETAVDELAIHFFMQFHLHLQLKAATDYAHANGIIVKGDIPIGIYRNSADAWQEPGLYNMDKQAGAPPDDFAIKGQNWGFPTYNWQRMQQDGFAWWKKRFAQMSYYFDAFRIDHILGFFRIWSIPMHAVEGIMGTFVPAVPVYKNELQANGIYEDIARLTRPFIIDEVLWQFFGEMMDRVKSEFIEEQGNGVYALKEAFDTQRKIEAHFNTLGADGEHARLKAGMFDLVSNVILFEAEGSAGEQYHFRIAMDSTASFRYLDAGTQHRLKELYVNYFFRRQDNYWMEEAMQKLPELKRSTNMLICGEDLGMVPDCVPGVMKALGILSLEIQRMPKDPTREFFHPNDAPYLSVVTPSTHDMSTIRGWWEEDPAKTQRFYNKQLGKWGKAPFFCEPEINTAIVVQHFYSPAMWSIFQLQDLLGMDGSLRCNNPADERINVPANPKHYWQYRMHLSLEELLKKDAFNTMLNGYIVDSGR